MPTAKEFANEVQEMALTITGYHTGKSGQNGLCDCIGLIMGAMANLGRGSYPMHSTNYFARYQMDGLRTLKSGETLQIGQLLYKHNDDQSDLNDRYKPGGRYHVNGDLRNYYHVGVVTDLSPLEITHCTQSGNISGIKRDSSTKGWTLVGELRGVDYALNYVDYEEEPTMSKTAFVTVEKGSTVNLRKRPDISAPLIKRINKGTVLDVLEQADGWAKVVDPDGEKGYVMTQFLKFMKYESVDDPVPAEDAPQAAPSSSFEQEVLERFDRLETLLNAILGSVGGVVG